MVPLPFVSLLLGFAGVRAMQVSSVASAESTAPQSNSDTAHVVNGNASTNFHLSNTMELISDAMESFHALKAGMSAAERSTTAEKQTNADGINAQWAKHRASLEQQGVRLRASLAAIKQNEIKLAVAQANVSALRAQAQDLLAQNGNLSDELKTVEKQLGSAQKLAGQALDFSRKRLEGARDVQILEELAAKDLHQYRPWEHKNSKTPPLSLLRRGVGRVESANDLIQRMRRSLGELDAKKVTRSHRLQKACDRLSAANVKKQKEATRRQAELNDAIADAEYSRVRLVTAVAFLTRAKAVLEKRVADLRIGGDTDELF